MGGMGGGILFSRRPYERPSIHEVLVFQCLEKAMTKFHKIWQTH